MFRLSIGTRAKACGHSRSPLIPILPMTASTRTSSGSSPARSSVAREDGQSTSDMLVGGVSQTQKLNVIPGSASSFFPDGAFAQQSEVLGRDVAPELMRRLVKIPTCSSAHATAAEARSDVREASFHPAYPFEWRFLPGILRNRGAQFHFRAWNRCCCGMQIVLVFGVRHPIANSQPPEIFVGPRQTSHRGR